MRAVVRRLVEQSRRLVDTPAGIKDDRRRLNGGHADSRERRHRFDPNPQGNNSGDGGQVPARTSHPEQIEEIGREFGQLHDEVFDDLGDRDARYIRSMIALHRRLALGGRVLLLASLFPPAWLAGTAVLSLAKILENMEIGHNVMHGQCDWMNDPVINSSEWDWDTASSKQAWKSSGVCRCTTWTSPPCAPARNPGGTSSGASALGK